MSRDISLQADVGNLGLQGLRGVSHVLAALSADNVNPLAMVQMESLGATLPTSGECAEKVKGLLQRCGDRRLVQLCMIVGWRKDDSASFMANSAGGQAVALVSVCLVNICQAPDTGTILGRLCSKLLPKSTNVSSFQQLAEVAVRLTGKLNTLGFGNLLAREVSRIPQAYEALGNPVPRDLLKTLDVESATDLLEAVSRALTEERKICRISGSRGMGLILGLVQVLFQRNTVVTVEGTIIQDVENSSIICEIVHREREELTFVHLETSISTTRSVELPIAIFPTTFKASLPTPCCFNWNGWLADRLQLTMVNYGLNCDQPILDACCNLLVCLPSAIGFDSAILRPIRKPKTAPESPNLPLMTLLGPLPQARIHRICKEVFRTEPAACQMDLRTTFTNLVAIMGSKAHGISCICPYGMKCEWKSGWVRMPPRAGREPDIGCAKRYLWHYIGRTLISALWCFFINASAGATVFPPDEEDFDFLTQAVTGKKTSVTARYIMHHVMALVTTRRRGLREVAVCSDSSTIYPTILETLSVPSHQAITFALVEGNLIFEGRYHRYLSTESVGFRPLATKAIYNGKIRPCHSGVHTGNTSVTVREGHDFLELICTVKYAGIDVKIDLKRVISGYITMLWTDPCPHPAMDCMDLVKYPAISTSVASPAAQDQIGVAMTRGNPVAQLLCCGEDFQPVLQHNSCLNCAAERLAGIDYVVLIVR